MRGKFFLWLLMGLVALALLYFVWLVLHAIYLTIEDLWRNRELGKLAVEYKERRQRNVLEAERRLDNGCEHDFDDQAGALPPDVCCRCGLARQKPPGACDHAWRVMPGIVPRSQCEKCHEEFTSVPAH